MKTIKKKCNNSTKEHEKFEQTTSVTHKQRCAGDCGWEIFGASSDPVVVTGKVNFLVGDFSRGNCSSQNKEKRKVQNKVSVC